MQIGGRDISPRLPLTTISLTASSHVAPTNERIIVMNNANSFESNNVSNVAEKPAVVLVHGAFSNSQVWGYVAGKLRAVGHPVVSVDLPGRSGAPMAADQVSLDL